MFFEFLPDTDVPRAVFSPQIESVVRHSGDTDREKRDCPEQRSETAPPEGLFHTIFKQTCRRSLPPFMPDMYGSFFYCNADEQSALFACAGYGSHLGLALSSERELVSGLKLG